jgi:FlaA1/EpsC-like NDP-sugar epimerase
LQGVIVVVLAAGILLGSISVGINAVLALAITALPTVLRRDFDIHLSPPLTLWLAGAVTLHAVGMIALYDRVWWWDHLTHFVSAALVAGVGYAVTVTLDEHSEAIHFPSSFLAVYILLFTVAAGVVWELLEMVGRELARTYGFEEILIVYGLEDTMLDLIFNMVGAIVVALAGDESLSRLVRWPEDWPRSSE